MQKLDGGLRTPMKNAPDNFMRSVEAKAKGDWLELARIFEEEMVFAGYPKYRDGMLDRFASALAQSDLRELNAISDEFKASLTEDEKTLVRAAEASGEWVQA